MREVTVTSKEELFILLLCYNDLSDYFSKSSLYYIIVFLEISLCLWQLSQVHLPLYSGNYCAIFIILLWKKHVAQQNRCNKMYFSVKQSQEMVYDSSGHGNVRERISFTLTSLQNENKFCIEVLIWTTWPFIVFWIWGFAVSQQSICVVLCTINCVCSPSTMIIGAMSFFDWSALYMRSTRMKACEQCSCEFRWAPLMSSYGIWNRNRCSPHVGALLQRVVSMGCHVSFTLIFSLAGVDCFH